MKKKHTKTLRHIRLVLQPARPLLMPTAAAHRFRRHGGRGEACPICLEAHSLPEKGNEVVACCACDKMYHLKCYMTNFQHRADAARQRFKDAQLQDRASSGEYGILILPSMHCPTCRRTAPINILPRKRQRPYGKQIEEARAELKEAEAALRAWRQVMQSTDARAASQARAAVQVFEWCIADTQAGLCRLQNKQPRMGAPHGYDPPRAAPFPTAIL